ncbi:MAG: hypothetical protein KAW12_14260 [Candidatus Aminicenantes bacterium]|nr:hypothetical protein [Candidatus Aminicenantes bacterium]
MKRSFFNHKIIWVYFPMVLISCAFPLIKIAETNRLAVVIPAVLLIVLAVCLSLYFNKKKKK